jgi:hypothetical protein
MVYPPHCWAAICLGYRLGVFYLPFYLKFYELFHNMFFFYRLSHDDARRC